METNIKEKMNDDRPYWKVVASLLFSLIGTFLFILIGIKGLLFFMPFVIGWFISFIASPVVNWLEKRLKIVKKLGSAMIIVLVLVLVIVGLYFAISRIWRELYSLVNNMPELYKELESGMDKVGETLSGIFHMLPEGIKDSWQTMTQDLDRTMGEIMGKVSEPTVMAAGNFAKKIPSVLIATVVTVISAYFFIAERENIIVWSKKVAPDSVVRRMTMVMDNLKFAVGGYFKAQFKIMAVVFVILLAGFFIMGVHFQILLAILIALLDFLPFFGTGTALIPWALYQCIVGDYKVAITLVIIYGVTQLVRQLIQPKLVGDSMGLNPLLTLILLYVGYKFGSVIGMILAVPLGMIVMNLFKARAFDYILDDVKILLEGIIELRNNKKPLS